MIRVAGYMCLLLLFSCKGDEVAPFKLEVLSDRPYSNYGITGADINGDSRQDIIVGGDSFGLYLNHDTTGIYYGDSFKRIDINELGSSEVFVVDMDGDGRKDLVASLKYSTTSVKRQKNLTGKLNNDSFEPSVHFSVGDGSSFTLISDIDGDNKPDLIICNYFNGLGIFQNNSTPGTFDASSLMLSLKLDTTKIVGAAVGDLNGDDKPEIIINFGYPDNKTLVYTNQSTTGVINASSFAAPVIVNLNEGGGEIVAKDMDGDHRAELIWMGYGNSVRIHKNSGAGAVIGSDDFNRTTFLYVGGGGTQINSFVLEDINNDKYPDAVIGVGPDENASIAIFISTTNANSVLPSFGSPFSFHTYGAPTSLAVGDFDENGRKDVIFVQKGVLSVCRNQNF